MGFGGDRVVRIECMRKADENLSTFLIVFSDVIISFKMNVRALCSGRTVVAQESSTV